MTAGMGIVMATAVATAVIAEIAADPNGEGSTISSAGTTEETIEAAAATISIATTVAIDSTAAEAETTCRETAEEAEVVSDVVQLEQWMID